VPLTLLFRHLRDDAAAMIGDAAATAFMRLGNHHEAEQAATFIGRQHTFTVSGWTVTHGGEHGTSRTAGYSRGTSQTRGWSGDGLFATSALGAQSRSRDHGRNQEWSQSGSESDGESWSDARNTQRVYEYAVEPAVLQNLPGNALLLPAHGTGHRDVPMLRLIGDLPVGTPVASGAAFGWGWLVELLEDYGFDPHLVHPLRCKAIASARLKNEVDAAILAQLLRADLLPEAWIAPPQVRQLRALLRHRASLVRLGTGQRNRIHAVAADHGYDRSASYWTGPGRAAAGWPSWTCPRRPGRSSPTA
jgi:transposase